MILLLDQNLQRELVEVARRLKPELIVHHTSDLSLSAEEDADIARWAVEHEAVVLTLNGDFADIRRFPPGRLPGVVRFRVFPTTVPVITRALRRLFLALDEVELLGALTVVSESRIRQVR